MTKQYYVYLLTNKHNTVVYVGVTNDLVRRIYEHREGLREGFTKRYRVMRLVHFEAFADVRDALEREKQLKGGSRKNKLELIRSNNPTWRDLYPDLV